MSSEHLAFPRRGHAPFPGSGLISEAAHRNGRNMHRLIRKLSMPLKWLSYRTGRVVVNTNPDRLYVESTNLCNLSCIMCPKGLGEMTRPLGHMDPALFRSIADEMAPRVETAVLHIWGEPLLHPHLVDMLRYCHRLGLRTEISTNAVALTEEKSLELLDSGLDVIYLCLNRPRDIQAYSQRRRLRKNQR
jgi:sulfatase maturation enzyme AslB (radical SAM superfamily)